MKFDSYISQMSPKKRHLATINFVNIDKTATESLISVFMMCLRDSIRHVTSANGMQLNSPSDTSVTSDDGSLSEPKVLPLSSPKYKCCVCGKSETGRRKLTVRSCSHRCCTGCISECCNKCSSLTPAVARSKNIVEPWMSSRSVSSRVQNNAVDTGTKDETVASLLPASRPRSNSFRSSKATTAATDSGKTKPDSSHSKSVSSNRAEGEFTSRPSRRRSSSLTRDDRRKCSEKCVICMDTMTDPKKLDCGHVFCAECIEAAFAHAAKCPCCGRIFGKLKGNQPAGGTMKVRKSVDDLAGYRGTGSLVINYEIPSGFQQVACDSFCDCVSEFYFKLLILFHFFTITFIEVHIILCFYLCKCVASSLS